MTTEPMGFNHSSKERTVLDRMIRGKAKPTMASELDVGLRAIDNRQRGIFTKFQADSVAGLVSLVLKLEDS